MADISRGPSPSRWHDTVCAAGCTVKLGPRDAYRIVERASGDTPARLRPFEAIVFDVAALWAR